jgi:hypothetical protein
MTYRFEHWEFELQNVRTQVREFEQTTADTESYSQFVNSKSEANTYKCYTITTHLHKYATISGITPQISGFDLIFI